MPMDNNNLNSETVLPELYFLIAHFLKNSPFRDTAHGLIEQMENWQVLPSRIDWRGVEHPRSFQEFIRGYNYIPCNFLLQMCNQLRFLLDNQLQNRLTSFNTLLGNGQYSLLQDVQKIGKKALVKTSNLDALPKDFYCKYTCVSNGPSVAYNYSSRMLNGSMSMIVNLNRLELGSRLHVSNVVQPEFYRSVNLHKRILGHLTCVYCICFDRTGRFILTGADDNLIKAWSATDGRLMATFRGHDKEISDIDINFENTLLASGSCDKMIRIWNLKTTESTTVLQTHLSMVTNVEFSPYCKGTVRWLASSGNDGLICFWQWNSKTLAFNPKPKKFIEKSRPGTQMLCLSFSPGGLFMAAGSNDNAIRVYYFDKDEPKKVGELESHTNWVDSIQFANLSARFLSGSKDGTARIWKYENSKFNAIFIDGSKTLQKTEQNEFLCSDNFKRHNVTMVAWNCDDTLVITAQSNFIIKVWNSDSAELIHELKGHQDEIYVLEAHPRDARIILSASHDGYIILWNILAGKMIRKFYNKIDNEGHASNFDTKWSPSLELFATTDSHGSLSIYGFGTDENYKKVPHEQFFHTDYRPLMGEPNSFVVDEQTQQPPHLMPPPFLVNAEGNPYSAEYQRLVPGRENLTNAQLIPNVITHENGISEIIGDRDAEDDADDRPNTDEAPARTRTRLLWLKNLIRPLDERTLSASESTRLEKLKLEEKESLDGIRAMDLSKNQSILFQFKENESTTERREMRNGGAGTSGGTATRRGGRARRRENGAPSSSSAANRNNLFDADFFDDESMHRIRPEYDENTLEDGFVDIVDEDSNTQHSTGANPSMSNMLQAMIGRQGSRASHAQTSSNMNNSNGETNNLPGTSGFGGAGNSRQSQPEERFVDMVASESDSSEYSDWAEEEGGRVLKPPTQRKSTRQQRPAQQRRKTKRVLKIVRDDEDEGQNSDNEHAKNSKSARLPTRTSSRRAKKIVSEDDDSSDKDEEVVIKSVGSKKNTDSKATNLSTDIDEEMNEDSGSNDSNDSSSEGDDDDDDERMDDDTFTDNDEQPCTSHAATSRSSTSKSPRKRGRPSGKHKVNSKLNKQLNLKGNLKECDPSFRPPEWLTSTKPKKSPYMPQVNDEVVYFRQGHELYVNEVKLKNEYEIEEKSLPWIKHKNHIGVQEFCLVINMKIEIKPPRLVCLRLKIVSGASAGTEFTIKYHDMAHVVDFVVLKQFYERGMEHNWKPNDRFKCIIDDIWYVGQIESKKPLDELYPDSPFQCLCVNWQTGESEQFSPWDLEPVCGVNSRKSKCPAQTDPPINGEQVTLDEMKSLLYVPNGQEWPTLGRDYECERILTGLEFIMELSIAEYFNFPVDLDAFPAYAQVIGYPIDLNTIKERLENRYYRRFKSILWDIRKIQENAVAFNEPKSDIVTRAIQLTKVLYEFINDHDCFNPKPIYKRICKKNSNNDNSILNQNVHEDDDDDEDDDDGENVENTTLDESTGVRGKTRSGGGGYRTLRRKANFNAPSLKFNLRSSSRLGGGSSGSNSAGSSKYFDDKSWYDPVKKIIDEMLKKEISHPFRQPVDTKTYRDYLDIIDEPMDLGTIRKRLSSKYYGSDIHKLDSECRLVFSNSKTYNTDKHSKIYDMTSRLEAFYLNRMHPILKKYDHLRKKPAPTSRMRRTRFDYDQLSTFKSEESFEQPSHGKASASASASSNSKITQQQSKYFASRSDLYDDQNANAAYSTRSSGRRSTKNYANESNAQTNYDRPTTSKSIKEEYVETDEYDDENDQTPSDDDHNVEYDLNDSKANVRERATSSTEQSTLANNHLEKKASLTSLLVESLAADEPPSRKSNNNNRVSQNNSETAVSFNDALCDDSNEHSEQKSNQKSASSSSKSTTVRKAQKRKSNNVYNERDRDDYDDDDDDDHNDVDEQSDSDYEQETINQKKKNSRARSNRSNNHIEKHEDEQKDETGSTNYEEDEKEDDDVEEEDEESTDDDEEDDDEDNRLLKYNNKKSARSNKKSKSKNKKVSSVRKSKSKVVDEEEEEEEEEDDEDDDDDDDDYEDEDNHHESKKKGATKKSKRHSSASLRAAANMDNKENDNKQFNQRQTTKNNHQQPTSKRLLNSSSNASLSTRSSRRTKRQCYREFSSSDNDDLDSPALSDEHETTYVKNKKSLNGTTGTDAGGSSKKARIAAPSHDEEEANHGFENLNGHTSHSFDYSNHNHHNENSLGAASTSNGNQQSLFKLSSRGRIVKTVSLRDS